MKQILPICLFLLLMTGCKERPEVSASLDRAEALMESAPDSALTLLQTLDTEKFRKRNTHARHALLFTQAQDKNYIDETNDSLINIAADYFRNHGDVRSRFLSLYYKGRIRYNAGDYLNAMLSYAEAEGLVPQLYDDYYVGLLYTQMGGVYRKYSDFPKSLEAYCKASEFYKQSDKQLHYLYAITDQSAVYRNLNDYVQSDSLLRTVLLEAERLADHSLMKYVLGCMFMQYVEQEKMQDAKIIFEKLINDYGIVNNTSSFMASVVKIHLSESEIQAADQALQKAWIQAKTVNDSIACYLVSSLVYKEKGQFDRAMQEQETGVLIQNRIVKENLQQPVLTMQRNYLVQELEHQEYKRKMNRLLSFVILMFVMVLALLLGYLMLKRLRKHYRKSLHSRLKQQEAANKRKIELLWDEAMQREQSIRQSLDELNQEMQQRDATSIEHICHLQEELNKQAEILHQYKEQREALAGIADKDRQKWEDLCVSLCRIYFKTLDNLFMSYFYTEYTNDKTKERAMNEFILKYANEYIICKGEKEYKSLEKTVDLYMNNVMTCFRTEVILSNKKNYQLVCFLFAGFSVNLLAHLMNCTTNAIYKRKDEILKKIKEQAPLHEDVFLKMLRKHL